MNRFKVGAMMSCLALLALVVPPGTKASEWDKRTTVTFSAPFEIPGVGAQVLPAGTYVFSLLGSQHDRNIVQIFNQRGDHIYATILAVPNYRLKSTDETVMTFKERAAGEPEAIRAWFYPGNNWGQEFVYPKKRAMELAKIANLPVLAMPTELATNLTVAATKLDEPPVLALRTAPIEAVRPSGEVVAVADVVEAPPVQTAAAMQTYDPERSLPRTASNAERSLPGTASDPERSLPGTASILPLAGLIGLLSLFAGLALWRLPKQPVL